MMNDKDDYRSLKSLTVVETEGRDRYESELSHCDEEAESLTFNESFAAHKYAGSFKLTYSTKENTVRGNKSTATEGTPVSSALRDPDIIVEEPEPHDGREEANNGQHLEAETQEVSLTFTMGKPIRLY